MLSKIKHYRSSYIMIMFGKAFKMSTNLLGNERRKYYMEIEIVLRYNIKNVIRL